VVSWLEAPGAFERFSPLTGPGLLVLDLAAPGGSTDPHGWHALAAQLLTLPCPVVALRPEGSDPAYAALEVAADVHARDEDEVALLARRIGEFPLASLALVQLLRQTPFLDVVPGLIAESWAYSTLQTGPEFARWLEAHRKGRRGGSAPDERPPVRARRGDGRLEIVLDRPQRHNAYSAAMRDGLVEALSVAQADDAITEVILRGEGASFCSGGDLDEFGTAPDPVTAHAVRSTRHPARALAKLAPRLRAELKGACIGAGVELPAWAGTVVAHENAFFELPELSMGLVPGAGGTVSLPRRIGRERTGWLALSGTRIDAGTAQRWGLVDQVRARLD
jgi:hypothetical protein